MRRTRIGGDVVPDDYIVVWEDLEIGRIHKAADVGGHHTWSWSCFLPNVPQRSDHRGRSGSLEAAKAQFRAAWEDLHSQVSYAQIREAKAIETDRRSWHK